MIETQNQKIINVTPPAAIKDAASFATTSIDTKGWKYCTILFCLGATDIAMTALKVQEADDDSTYVDITGATFAGALPSATDDNKVYAFHINLRGNRKRYLDLVATAGDGAAGTFGSAIAILSNGEANPASATAAGLGGWVIV